LYHKYWGTYSSDLFLIWVLVSFNKALLTDVLLDSQASTALLRTNSCTGTCEGTATGMCILPLLGHLKK